MQKKRTKSPPFVMIPKKMIRSKAWKELKHYSVRAYIHIASKYNGSNEKDLSFTYKEASRFMNVHTYKKATDQLVKYGFIDIMRSGKGYARLCNIFALSKRWEDYGTKFFKEGKRIVIP